MTSVTKPLGQAFGNRSSVHVSRIEALGTGPQFQASEAGSWYQVHSTSLRNRLLVQTPSYKPPEQALGNRSSVQANGTGSWYRTSVTRLRDWLLVTGLQYKPSEQVLGTGPRLQASRIGSWLQAPIYGPLYRPNK